jgi:hypothetical protein
MRRLSDYPEYVIDKMNFDAAVFGFNNNLKTHAAAPYNPHCVNENRLSNKAITFNNEELNDQSKHGSPFARKTSLKRPKSC